MEVTQPNRVSVHRRIVEGRQTVPGTWRIGKNPTRGVLEGKASGSGDTRDGCNRTKARRNVSTTLRQWPLEFRLGFLRLVLVD